MRDTIDKYPLMRKWYIFMKWLFERSAGFPKHVRHTYTYRVLETALTIQETILELMYSKEKRTHIQKVNLLLERLRIMLRLGYDLKYLSLKHYEHSAREVEEAGKMLGGWGKYEAGR